MQHNRGQLDTCNYHNLLLAVFSPAKQRALTSLCFEKRLEMSFVRIVEASAANNSPSQVSSHPNDHFQSRD